MAEKKGKTKGGKVRDLKAKKLDAKKAGQVKGGLLQLDSGQLNFPKVSPELSSSMLKKKGF